MSYEITYYYHDRKEEGGYNTDEKKELTKRVGKVLEDTPLEKAAAAIMSQLARRDIWVVDVKVIEYVKKEVSFKEAKDGAGIVLKNKKFALDNTANVLIEEEEVEAVPQIEYQAQSPRVNPKAAPGTNLAPEAPVNQNRALFYAIFEPEGWVDEARRRGLKFTVGNRYPVHRTKDDASDVGSIFYLTDDTKRLVEVNEKYFAVVGRGLIGDNDPSSYRIDEGPKPKLMYDDQMRHQPTHTRTVDRSQIPDEWRHFPVDGEEAVDAIPPMPQLRQDY